MASADSWNVVYLVNVDTGAAETRNAGFVVAATEGWMSLLCGTKVALHA